MSRRRVPLLAILALQFSFGWAFSATTQVEFVATLESVAPEVDGVTVLTVALTPTVSFPVRVGEGVEIRDENDLPISVSDLAPGMLLKIKGIFTLGGIVAREIEVQDDGSEFDIRGVIQEVAPAGDAGTIIVSDFRITVPPDAEIKDHRGNQLEFGDLAPGQFARVRGAVAGESLVARRVSIRKPGDKFARVRLEGAVSEILSEMSFKLSIEGGVEAVVELDERTEIKGTLAVGALAKVEGSLTERLTVLARRVIVFEPVRLTPGKLKMRPGQVRTVNVILLSPRDQDAVFDLVSHKPAVAVAVPDQATVPAGQLTTTFEVHSGAVKGETEIEVSTEGFSGKVKVEVGEKEREKDDKALELRWEPRSIHAAPKGSREVRLRINDKADEDLTVLISLRRGTEGFVMFPAEVVIPAGKKEVRLELVFLKDQGSAVLRATLPEAVGGDSDDLEISLKSFQSQKLHIRWNPDELKLKPDSAARVELRLDRPAPFALDAVVTLKSGNRGVVPGFPSRVSFAEGASSAIIEFRTGNQNGKVKFLAALPVQAGGGTDELEIKVEN